MSKKVFNMQGGKHSAAAYSELEKWAYGSCVASLTSFVASAGTGMNLNISTGAGIISDTIARRIGTDAVETAAVPTASASFNRIDTLVAYIDTAISPTTAVTDNTNDILKFVVVAGTASGSPSAPNDAAVLTAIGAGKPFMRLFNVLVPQNAASAAVMTLTDVRNVLKAVPAGSVGTTELANLGVTTGKVAANAIDKSKLALSVSDMLDFSNSEKATGFLWVDGKVIYKRTFSGTITQAVNTRSTVNLVASGIDKIVAWGGWYDEGGGLIIGAQTARMDVSGNITGGDGVWCISGSLSYISKSGATRTNAPYAITVYYTK